MTGTPISQPFDLIGIGSSSRAFGVILITIAIALGVVAYGLLEGYVERPVELATLPLDMLCGGGALLFFVVGLRAYFSHRLYRVDPLKQTIQRVTGGVFGTHYGEEIPFNQLAYVQIARYEPHPSSFADRPKRSIPGDSQGTTAPGFSYKRPQRQRVDPHSSTAQRSLFVP